ncbi:MAG: hypothetical protein WCE62_13130 [Polyangiales bacterium]
MTLLAAGQTARQDQPDHVQPNHVHRHYRCENTECGATFRDSEPDPVGGDDTEA